MDRDAEHQPVVKRLIHSSIGKLMKRLIHWGLILSVAGGSFGVPALTGYRSAIALPESEILKRLNIVPVFIITDQKGNLIPAFIPNPKDKTKKLQFVSFFTSHKEAQTVIARLKTSNPEVGNIAKVTTISLGQAYNLKKENAAKKEVLFDFRPIKQQVDYALAILEQDGQSVKGFNSIPLFFLTEKTNKTLPLTIGSGEQQFTPFYFSKQDVQGVLNQLKTQQPQMAQTMRIQVTSLDSLIQTLQKGNAPGFALVNLVPDKDSLQFAVQQQATGAQPAKSQ